MLCTFINFKIAVQIQNGDISNINFEYNVLLINYIYFRNMPICKNLNPNYKLPNQSFAFFCVIFQVRQYCLGVLPNTKFS